MDFNHPNLVTLIGVAVQQRPWLCVLEYMEVRQTAKRLLRLSSFAFSFCFLFSSCLVSSCVMCLSCLVLSCVVLSALVLLLSCSSPALILSCPVRSCSSLALLSFCYYSSLALLLHPCPSVCCSRVVSRKLVTCGFDHRVGIQPTRSHTTHTAHSNPVMPFRHGKPFKEVCPTVN